MFKSILLPIRLNNPDTWADAFAAGCRMARDYEARLTLATIIPHWVTSRDADYSWEAKQWFEKRARSGLYTWRAKAGHRECEILVHWGSVPGSIIDMADEVRADLIVLPAKGPHISNLFHRPAALRLAERAPCSVMLVRSLANPDRSPPVEVISTAS